MNEAVRRVFIAGATGYVGGRLAGELARQSLAILSMRPRFSKKLAGPIHCAAGGAQPGPTKARQFREIDLRSCEQSV
jgi:aspartate-semialdehyde dehydrogenase